MKFRPVNERTSGIRLSNDEEGRSCHFSISQRVIISLFIACLYLTICVLFASSGKCPNSCFSIDSDQATVGKIGQLGLSVKPALDSERI